MSSEQNHKEGVYYDDGIIEWPSDENFGWLSTLTISKSNASKLDY